MKKARVAGLSRSGGEPAPRDQAVLTVIFAMPITSPPASASVPKVLFSSAAASS